jgi:hypothetical protein
MMAHVYVKLVFLGDTVYVDNVGNTLSEKGILPYEMSKAYFQERIRNTITYRALFDLGRIDVDPSRNRMSL